MTFPFTLLDLTHTLSPSTPSWNGSCGFSHSIKLDYQVDAEVSFRVQQIKMHAGIGTHIDAPAHCIPGGLAIDALPLENLVAPCVCIDVSKKADAFYVASVDDMRAFEQQYGAIEKGSVVIVRAGWDVYWNDPEKYRNDYHFPSISKDVAEWLLDKEALALGVDTLSPDCPDSDYPVHQAFLGSGKYLIENLAQTALLPAKGSYLFSLPIKTLEGTEAPARCVALLPLNLS